VAANTWLFDLLYYSISIVSVNVLIRYVRVKKMKNNNYHTRNIFKIQ